MSKVETDCGESIKEERHEDDERVHILEDVSEDDNHGHDRDRYDGDEDCDGEPTNPVQPIWQSHHFGQLFHSSLLLFNNPL